MGLADLFQKKTNYFDKKMTPQCGYCQYGKRTKDGNRILCSKTVNLKEETDSCGKFIYSPLKRIPVKQLKNEGLVADEEIYVEIKEEEAPAPAKEPAKTQETAPSEAPAEAAPAEAAPLAEESAPAVESAPTEEVPAAEPVASAASELDALAAAAAQAESAFAGLSAETNEA